MGDFNGDGTLDLVYPAVSVPSIVNLITFLQGNGDGTFRPPVGVPTSVGFTSVQAADLNGDGNLDLAASGPGSGTGVSVFLGNGDGTFGAPTVFDTGGVSPVAISDFNADGKLDVAVNDPGLTGFGLDILLGNGDGTFQAPLFFATPHIDLGSAADFNNDGRTDLYDSWSDNGTTSVILLLEGQIPVAAASPAALAFGQQATGTSSPPLPVTLTNTGTGTMSISNISISGTNAGDFGQTNTCGATLLVGAVCQISVTFTPVSAGTATAALNISDSSPGSPQSIGLTGATPTYLSPASISFPAQYVGTSGLPQSVTLNNTGTAPLIISGVTASTADFAALSSCGSSLAAGSSCSIGVFFDPSASGTRMGTLTVVDSAPDSPQVVTLTGTGEDFSVAASSPSQTVSPGQTATYSLTLSPLGGFKQSVQLSCTGAPAGATCTVSPSSISLNGTAAQTASVTVATAGSSAGLLVPAGRNSKTAFGVWLSLSGVFGLVPIVLPKSPRRRMRQALLRTLMLLCALAVLMTPACGGGSGSNSGGPQAGTYNLTVTGVFSSGSTTLTHTTKLTLTVQ